MDLTIIIPFWNGHRTIGRLVDSLPANLPVIIVDDHSDEPLQPNQFGERVMVLRPPEKGYFTGAVNYGIQHARTDVLILNQDTWLEGTAWLELLDRQRNGYAMIGERIKGNHPAWPDGYIHGTFMFLRRDAIEETGLLDAHHFPLWGSTADYQCRLARKGYKALALPEVLGFHHERDNAPYGESISEILRRRPELKGQLIRTPPLISVVITTYNYGRYLTDAVNSLIGGPVSLLGDVPPQTFQGFEVVIVDDGSIDETREVAQGLVSSAAAIRYLYRENGGSAAAMNTGVQAANGRYIAPLDGDDMMTSDRLRRMLAAAESNPHKVVYDNVLIVRPDREDMLWKMQPYDFTTLLERNVMHKGLLYPKAAWSEVGGYPESMNQGREDWAFNIALGSQGWCGVHVDHPGYLYRRSGQNRTLYNTTPAWREHFIEQIRALYPRLYAGERPQGCCGGSENAPVVTRASQIPKGMVMIEYRGGNAASSSYWGHVTQRRYEFGGTSPRNLVHEKDVPHFLDTWEGGQPIFAKA